MASWSHLEGCAAAAAVIAIMSLLVVLAHKQQRHGEGFVNPYDIQKMIQTKAAQMNASQYTDEHRAVFDQLMQTHSMMPTSAAVRHYVDMANSSDLKRALQAVQDDAAQGDDGSLQL